MHNRLPAHLAPAPSNYDAFEQRVLREHRIRQLQRETYVLPFEGTHQLGKFVRVIENGNRLQAVARFPNGYHGLFEGESWNLRHIGRAPKPDWQAKPARQERAVTVTQVSFFRRVFR